MRLELGYVNIKDVQFGGTTEIKEAVLYVSKEEMLKSIGEDPRLQSIDIELAKPGEEVRITPVKDVIQPRVKVEGPGGVFPGFVSKVDNVGSGITHVIRGANVLTVGKIVGFQEGLIDMTGPGAEYTPFSKSCNIVVVCEPARG